jgi:ABC-2 type transport system ATP-binding protein
MQQSIRNAEPVEKGEGMTGDAWAIVARGLRKSYGDHVVLDGIDLDIPEGTVFSLLGPNGAGKTTTVQILSTLIRTYGGEASILGYDVAKQPSRVRSVIGMTGQFLAVDNLLTGEENLNLMADLCHVGRRAGHERVADLLERFDLTEAAGRTAATYSGGMRRKLDLAMTLVASPRVIFLDEPTTGLDPRSRQTMWGIVSDLVAAGTTIFLTTQYLEEADALADRVAVLDNGKVVAEGSPESLKRRVPGGHIRLNFTEVHYLDAAAAALPHASRDDEGLVLQVPSDGSMASLRAVLDRLDREAIEVATVSVQTPNLDDVFFALTGRSATERETVA